MKGTSGCEARPRPTAGDNPVSADAPVADTDEKIYPVSLRSSHPEGDSLVLE